MNGFCSLQTILTIRFEIQTYAQVLTFWITASVNWLTISSPCNIPYLILVLNMKSLAFYFFSSKIFVHSRDSFMVLSEEEYIAESRDPIPEPTNEIIERGT